LKLIFANMPDRCRPDNTEIRISLRLCLLLAHAGSDLPPSRVLILQQGSGFSIAEDAIKRPIENVSRARSLSSP
jgi:hypothetical protein